MFKRLNIFIYMKQILTFFIFLFIGNHLIAQLIIYQNLDQTGSSASCAANTVFKGLAIPGGLNDNIKSITLSQGYQATLAVNENGTGESFCYVAAVSNITVNLAFALQDKISFIRVLPITNIKKKGACTQNDLLPDLLNASWFYDWGTNDVSSASKEYALMAWGSNWVTEAKIDGYISKPNITSLLTFNEPDAVGQSNITVGNGIAFYKKLLRTGYRMGSPAPTEGEWDNWLLDFMTLSKQDTVRVDYIAVHWYDWGNWLSTNNASPNANDVLNRLKSYINAVYNLHKKPIWLTEFNCNKFRTGQTHLDFLALAMAYLDGDPRVERYSYFFEDHLPESINGELTPLGQLYKNNASKPAIAANIIDTRGAFQELVSWNTSAIKGGGQSVLNFMPTSIAANLTAVTGLTRGDGTSFSASSVSDGFWGSNGFARLTAANGIDSNKTVTFRLQSTNNKNVSYKSIDSFKVRIASNGPISYYIDFRINENAFIPITTLTGLPRTTGNYSLNSVDLSGIAALQNVPPTSIVTFRITPYDCSGNGVSYFGAGTSDPTPDLSVSGLISDNSTLPITLTAFKSQRVNHHIKLTWTTHSEINFSHFLLERSKDASTYEVLANIKAVNSYAGNNYAYDDSPNHTNPKFYYRIKMIDNNGKFTYSRVIVENFVQKKSIVLQPSLVIGNQMTVHFDRVSIQGEMRILAKDGKLIQLINLKEGARSEMLDLSNLASGMYILFLQDADGIQTSKFIKQ